MPHRLLRCDAGIVWPSRPAVDQHFATHHLPGEHQPMTIVDVGAPDCASDPGSLCEWMWEHTGLDFFALHADAVLTGAAHILLIVLISLLARALIYRAINHLTRLTAEGETPVMLRPLRAPARRA